MKLGYCICVYTEGFDIEVDYDCDESYLNIAEDGTVYLTKGWYEECEQGSGSYDSCFFKREVVEFMPLPEKQIRHENT